MLLQASVNFQEAVSIVFNKIQNHKMFKIEDLIPKLIRKIINSKLKKIRLTLKKRRKKILKIETSKQKNLINYKICLKVKILKKRYFLI